MKNLISNIKNWLRRAFKTVTFRGYLNAVEEAESLKPGLTELATKILDDMIAHTRKTKKASLLKETIEDVRLLKGMHRESERLYNLVATDQKKVDEVHSTVLAVSNEIAKTEAKLTWRANKAFERKPTEA